MKILKKGNIPQPKPRLFRGTCLNCGAVVEVDESEVQYTGERRPGGHKEYWVACPTELLSMKCGCRINLEEVIYRGDDEEEEVHEDQTKPPPYPVNYPHGTNANVLPKTKRTLADEFEKFFSDDSDEVEIDDDVRRSVERAKRAREIRNTARLSAQNLLRALRGPHGERCNLAPEGAVPPKAEIRALHQAAEEYFDRYGGG
jgi:hypothetical protein